MENFIRIMAGLLLFLSIGTQAKESAQKDTLKLSLYFRTNTVSADAESRRSVARAISAIPSEADIIAVRIEGWASPEGSEEHNWKIAADRAAAAGEILKEYFNLPDNTLKSGNTDWMGMVELSKKHFCVEEYEAIIRSMKLPAAQRLASLSKIRNGGMLKDLDSRIFPLLRRADITVEFFNPGKENISGSSSLKDTVVIYHKDTVYYMPDGKRRDSLKDRSIRPETEKNLRRPVLAFRSNLLMPLLNVGVEFPVSNRWSAAADFYYPWCPREWMNKWCVPQMNCIQVLGGFLQARYWLGLRHREHEPACCKYRLLGHSLGLVAAGAFYDLEFGGTGQQGELFAAGIGYTYAVPLGRKGGVHLEFDFALGGVYHIRHPYNVYREGGYLLRQKDRNNVGIASKRSWSVLPIRAGLNLSVPIPEAKQTGREASL